MNSIELRDKLAKEFKLNEAIKEANLKEFDEWMDNLGKKNGYTEYQNMKEIAITVLVGLLIYSQYLLNKNKKL